METTFVASTISLGANYLPPTPVMINLFATLSAWNHRELQLQMAMGTLAPEAKQGILGLVQDNSMTSVLHGNGVAKLVLILSNLHRSQDTIGVLVHGGSDVQVTNHEESGRSTGEITTRK